MDLAATNLHEECETLLLDKGADVDARSRGSTALLKVSDLAGEAADRLVKRLVQRGANVNAVDPELLSPLYKAIRLRNIDRVRFLLENGADAYYVVTETALGNVPSDIAALVLDYVDQRISMSVDDG